MKCILATQQSVQVSEIWDKRLALEMLWKHGISDLLSVGTLQESGTLKKIIYLHRVYLLPCLVAQVYDKPQYKKTAFNHLDLYFGDKEIEVLQAVSKIWKNWQSPLLHVRFLAKIARIAKFNPFLYPKLSLEIGNRLPWLHNAPQLNWDDLSLKTKLLSERVWLSAVHEVSNGSK